MNNKPVYLTAEGLEKLKSELQHLVTKERPRVGSVVVNPAGAERGGSRVQTLLEDRRPCFLLAGVVVFAAGVGAALGDVWREPHH